MRGVEQEEGKKLRLTFQPWGISNTKLPSGIKGSANNPERTLGRGTDACANQEWISLDKRQKSENIKERKFYSVRY